MKTSSLFRAVIAVLLCVLFVFMGAVPAFARVIRLTTHLECYTVEYDYNGTPRPADDYVLFCSSGNGGGEEITEHEGQITVEYADSEEGPWTSEVPVEAGSYYYKISFTGDPTFLPCTLIGSYDILPGEIDEDDGGDYVEPPFEGTYLDAIIYIDYYDNNTDFVHILKTEFFDMDGNKVDINLLDLEYELTWDDRESDTRKAFGYIVSHNEDYEIATMTVVNVYDREAFEEEQNRPYVPPIPETDEPSIILMNAIESHEYEAYQLFAGTVNDNYDSDGNFVSTTLSNITWGSAANSEVIAALTEWYQTETGKNETPSAADVAKLLNDANIGEVAKLFGSLALSENALTPTEDYVEESQAYIFAYENPGLWLVRDKDGSVEDLHESATAFILATTRADENTVLYLKQPIDPEVDKDASINSFISEEYGDLPATYASYGSVITYTLTATFPGNYADDEANTVHNFDRFESYFFRFTDTIPAGLELDVNSLTVYTNFYKDEPIPEEYYEVTVLPQADGSTYLIVTFDDLMTLPYKWLDEGNDNVPFSSLHVDYETLVTSDAPSAPEEIINTVYGTYSNDPDGVGFGKTPEAEVRIMLSTLELSKTDPDGNPLEGAEFIIGWWMPREGGTGRYPDRWVVRHEDGTYSFVQNREDATVFVSDENGQINLKGLCGKGGYSAVEVKAPAGYNKLEKMVDFTHAEDYIGRVTVINEKGLVLPSTGGMGLTLIYAVGGLLLVGGGIWFFVRSRRNEEDDEDEN